MAISWEKFKSLTLGKGFDIDGYYGVQCWDLFAKFCKEQKIPIFNCSTTGYVKDIWNNRYTSGILKYFDIVDKKNLSNGDWVIFPTSYKLTPSSHIGMYYKGQLLGQNQGSQPKVTTLINIDFTKALGGLRFKNYPKESALNVGDKVMITGIGSSTAYGNGGKAYGIGWTRQILRIYPKASYPYQVGNKSGTTGFYKKGNLKKL